MTEYNGMKPGDTILYNHQRMKLVGLRRISGGVAAELAGIAGETYPHPVYATGFTTAAIHMAVPLLPRTR